jgi:hypothetical protein
MEVAAELVIPRVHEIKEPRMVALVVTQRAGSKLLQSYLDGHDNILMIPAYPLLYLYPHWSEWCRQLGPALSWERLIDLLCEKHASVIDSRRVRGMLGLERLGPDRNQHIEIDEGLFRRALRELLEEEPISRRTFLLAIHYAYGICKGWDLTTKRVLLYHLHHPEYLKELAADFPTLKVIAMVRNPRGALGSACRVMKIIDEEKLNVTDGLIYTGRLFRLATHQFNFFDPILSCPPPAEVVAVRLESLHADVERTMRTVTGFLGLEFLESTLRSTFDGKTWWGDVSNKEPVYGPDPKAMTDHRWKRVLGRLGSFMVEGIFTERYDTYGYERTTYRRDTWSNRVRVALAVLWPTPAERQLVGFYLNPGTHARVLRAAWREATGSIPLKDYTWSATYRYKWTYRDLTLWRLRWHQRFLRWANRKVQSSRGHFLARALAALSRALYVAAQYSRFWFAFIALPTEIVKRWGIYYSWLGRRLRNDVRLPRLLV